MLTPLLLLLLLLLGLGPLLPLTDQSRVTARVAELPVRLLLAGVVADLALDEGCLVVDGEVRLVLLDLAVVCDLFASLGLLGRRVAVLGCVGLAGEEHETGLVGLQTLDVGGEGLLGQVLAAGVDADADGGSQLAGNAGFL